MKRQSSPSIFQPYHRVPNVTSASKLWKQRVKCLMFLFLLEVTHPLIFWTSTRAGWIYGANSAGVFPLHSGAEKLLVGAWKAIASSSVQAFFWGELRGVRKEESFSSLCLFRFVSLSYQRASDLCLLNLHRLLKSMAWLTGDAQKEWRGWLRKGEVPGARM